MRKGLLAIAAAGSLFAITAAGATGFGLDLGSDQTVSAPAVGSAHVTLNGCTETFNLAYTTDDTGITGLVATSSPTASLAADCGSSATATVTIGGSDPATGSWAPGGTAGALTDIWTFTLDAPVATTDTSLLTTMTIN